MSYNRIVWSNIVQNNTQSQTNQTNNNNKKSDNDDDDNPPFPFAIVVTLLCFRRIQTQTHTNQLTNQPDTDG